MRGALKAPLSIQKLAAALTSASADYRRDLVAVLVKRALTNAHARATVKEKELVA